MTQKLVQLRSDASEKMRKAVVVGNGAIRGGSEVLASVISSLGGRCAELHALLEFGVSYSYYAANMRTNKNLIIQEFLRTNGDPKAFDFEDHFRTFRLVEKIRQDIAEAYVKAYSSVLKIRQELDVYQPDLASSDVGVITVNWDELLWGRQNLNLIQLHGRVSFGDSLILPMELIADGFLYEALKLAVTPEKDITWLKGLFRGEWQERLNEAESLAFRWIDHVDELVIYGIAVNPYDAELLQVLRYWNNLKVRGFKKTRVNDRPNLTVVNTKIEDAERAARFLCVEEYLWINPKDNASAIINLGGH